MLELYYWPTPNGKKVTILLEELGVAHKLTPLNIRIGEQFEPGFMKISPNTRIPALVDHAPIGGGEAISIFESGAIMLYLAEREGRFLPSDPRGKAQVTQWVMWQMANQGPKFGEASYYLGAEKDGNPQPFALNRYLNEVNRLLGVMDLQLGQTSYLAGAGYSIADMICYPWIAGWSARTEAQGAEVAGFAHLDRWRQELAARPGIQRGMAVTVEGVVPIEKMTPEEQERRKQIVYGQRARTSAAPS